MPSGPVSRGRRWLSPESTPKLTILRPAPVPRNTAPAAPPAGISPHGLDSGSF